MKITLQLILSTLILTFLSFTSPYTQSTEIKEIFDLSYYEGDPADANKHKLNLFLPEGVKNPPVMLWIHGGAWAFGDRSRETLLARNFAKEGIAVAAMSYRLSPGTWADPSKDTGIQHPEHIKDVARAVKWLYENAKEYGFDKKKIIVSGYSAGAHLAALLVLDETYLNEVGMSISDLYASIPVAGGYDLVDYYHSQVKEGGEDHAKKHVNAALGDTFKDLKKASPIEYIKNSQIPMLVVSETYTYDFTLLFENAIKEQKVKHIEFYHVRDLDHTGLYMDMAKKEDSEHNAKIMEFINKL